MDDDGLAGSEVAPKDVLPASCRDMEARNTPTICITT